MEMKHEPFSSHEHPLELCKIAAENPSKSFPLPSSEHRCSIMHHLERRNLWGLNQMCSIICLGCKDTKSLDCSACKETISLGDWIYTCKSCNYNLHVSCSQIPRLIHHALHPHPLIFHPPRKVSLSSMKCDICFLFIKCGACGLDCNTDSFYRCSTCNFGTHIRCASLPLSVKHQSHGHLLSLASRNPFHEESFSCGVCWKSMEPGTWFYRCNRCGYDAHISCATGIYDDETNRTLIEMGFPPLKLDAHVNTAKSTRKRTAE